MSQENNFVLTVVDTVDVQEYLPQSGVEFTLAEEHGIFIDIEVKTADEHNQLLDNLVNRFGAGIFNDGEIPERA